MSVSSNGSAMSISFRGQDDVDLDDCLDQLFKELQSNLNNCQYSIRSLAQTQERNDTYIEASKYHFEIEDYVTELLSLFKELKLVSKLALGKPPPEHKVEYAQMLEKRKLDIAFNKLKIDDIKE
jgi:hypothetical protein